MPDSPRSSTIGVAWGRRRPPSPSRCRQAGLSPIGVHLAAGRRAQVAHLAPQGAAGQRALERDLERLGVGGLQEVVAGPALQALHRGGDRALAGEHHDRQRPGDAAWTCRTSSRPSAPGRRKSVSTTSTGACAEHAHGLRDGARLDDVVAALAQDLARANRARRPRPRRRARGRAARLAAPAVLMRPPCGGRGGKASSGTRCRRPAAAAPPARPPCCRTIEWQIDRPRPVESLVEKNGSKMRSRSRGRDAGPAVRDLGRGLAALRRRAS